MPRYFFHVHDGEDRPDFEGTELADLETARRQAVITAGCLLRDHAEHFWNGEEWKMEVSDDSGQTLFVLMFVAVSAPALQLSPA